MTDSAHRALKRARFEDREAVDSDNDTQDLEPSAQGGQYSQTGIDDGTQEDDDNGFNHRLVDNMRDDDVYDDEGDDSGIDSGIDEA